MHAEYFNFTSSKNGMIDGLYKFKEAMEDPEVFQKIFIVACSAIQSANFHCGTNYFPKVVPFLEVAAALDFYAFLRIPHHFLFPYSFGRIDENAVLNSLEKVLTSSKDLGEGNSLAVKSFAKEQLQAFLERMSSEDVAFSSEDKIKKSLQEWMRKGLEVHPVEGIAAAVIDLKGLKIDLKPAGWLVNISEYSLIGADLFCVPDFLQLWGVINLERCTAAVGQIPLFSKLTEVCLGDIVSGFLGVGFLFQFLKATQDLLEGDLSSEEALEAVCILICSAAEVLYNCSNLIGSSPKVINDLALLAKGMGLVVYFYSSKPVFFREKKQSVPIQ